MTYRNKGQYRRGRGVGAETLIFTLFDACVMKGKMDGRTVYSEKMRGEGKKIQREKRVLYGMPGMAMAIMPHHLKAQNTRAYGLAFPTNMHEAKESCGINGKKLQREKQGRFLTSRVWLLIHYQQY